MGKTVYILGAGFSIPAGAPSQSALLKKIFDLSNSTNIKNKAAITGWISEFYTFLTETLSISDKEIYNVTLEDIFTPLDRCLLDEISFRDIDVKALSDKREKFYNLIILALRSCMEEKKLEPDSYVHKFADYLINEARKHTSISKEDTLAIITTNWDIALDNVIQNKIDLEPKPKGKPFSGVVDYCCYISSLDENDKRIKPGLFALGMECYNVKLLKLHGSMNWLQCPKCQRLYVKHYRKWPAGYVFHNKHCRHCENNFKTVKGSKENKLHTNLIMPTFLKDLNNFQIKLIWQNAGVELSEATKIVFLGYSLPQADFELRQLLSRMIRKDAKIEVVLAKGDDPQKYNKDHKHNSAGYRYKLFFSGRKPIVHYYGVEKFIEKLLTI